MLHPALIVWFWAGFSVADDGDDFSNNLFSDLAPLLALFGERVTMQFMSQSMGWADNLILAMGPLGIITIIVSAIRVGGPKWLKALVGRARENRVAPEMELLSSTSGEVGELWNGSEVVRCMGKCPLTEFIILVPKKGLKEDSQVVVEDNWKKYLKQASSEHNGSNPSSEKAEHKKAAIQISCCIPFFKNSPNEENGQAQDEKPEEANNPHPDHDNNGRQNHATDKQSSNQNNDVIVIRIYGEKAGNRQKTEKTKKNQNVENAPNISLNCHKLASPLELWIVAIIGTILQLGVVAYWAFATYHPTLQYPKDGKKVADYAYTCAAAGTLTLVVGMMLCSHVVESRTKEREYVPCGKAHDIYFCWLQQEKIVNDQSFNSHIIYCKKKNKHIVISERDGEESRMKTLTVFSTLIALSGFVVQFVGLRGLHWSASVTQLGIVLFMLACKAFVRRGLASPPKSSDSLKSGFELEWLTKVLCERSEPAQETAKGPAEETAQETAPGPAQKTAQGPAQGPAQETTQETAQDPPQDPPQDLALDLALKWLEEQIEKLRAPGPQGTAEPSGDAALAWFIRGLRRGRTYIVRPFLSYLYSFFSDTGDAERSKNQDPVRRLVGWLIKILHRIFGSAGDAGPLRWFTRGLPSSLATIDEGVASEPRQIPDWMVNNFGRPEFRMAEPTVKSPAHSMMKIRRDLGQLADWHERPSKEAIAVTKSIEIAMNTLFPEVEGPEKPIYWSIKNSKDQEIGFQIHHKKGKFTADFMEMDAILSLWLFADSQKYSEDESKPSREDGKTDSWLRSKGLLPGSALCLLGPYSEELHRDIWWWMPTKENPVFLVQKCETGNIEYDSDENLGGSDENSGDSIPNFGESYGRVVGSVFEYDWVEKPETRLKISQLNEPRFGEETFYGEALDEERAKPEGFFATEKKTSVELVYAQHIFSAFMSAAATDKSAHINISKTTLRTEATTNGGAWKSFTVMNETISKMAIEIQQTGLGSLEEVYQSILPPLSLSNKLPQPDGMIELARKKARAHEKAGQWGEAGGIYLSLLRRIKTYPKNTAIAIKAIATIMQFWRQVVFAIDTEMAGYVAVIKLGEKLEKQLRDINEETFLELKSLYITQGRGRAWEDDLSNTELMELNSFRDEFGITASHKGVRSGYLRNIGHQYMRSADVFGWTPLHYASVHVQGQDHWLLLNIENAVESADINVRDLIEWTPLHYACCGGKIDVVQTILRFGADVNAQGTDNFTPLHCAAYHGHEEIVAALIEAGAGVNFQDVFGNSPLFWAIREHREPVCRLLYGKPDLNKKLRNFKGMTALHQAAGFGDQVIVELLLDDHMQDVNAKDRFQQTPLHLAAKHGQEEAVIELLLEKGADIEARGRLELAPLHMAAEAGQEAVVRLLLEKRADIEATTVLGQTPLKMAADTGQEAVVRLLLEKRANIEARDFRGWTALHAAAQFGREAVARLLLENGANIEAKCSRGKTPLKIAEEAGQGAVFGVLLNNVQM